MTVPRVAVITSYYPRPGQPHGGQTAYQTLRRLTDRMEIEVFCPFTTYPRWLRPQTFKYTPVEPSRYDGKVPVSYLNYPGIPGLSRPVNGWVAYRKLLPHLRRFKPDLLLSYMLYPEGYAAIQAARRFKIPSVLCAIGSDVRRIPDPITGSLTRKTVRGASALVTVSEELRTCVLELGAEPKRCRTVLNGVDTAIFRPSDRDAARARLMINSTARLVVFVGTLARAKGVFELLEAAAQLIPSRPDLKVAFVGAGVAASELVARSHGCGLAENVFFPGLCDAEQVSCWMAAADLFCLPSHSEGCPNVVLEALACGRPVVASNVGGIPELIDAENGILVQPSDSQSLAHAINAALDRAWDERRISRSFRRSWDNVASEIYDICLAALTNFPAERPAPDLACS